MITAKELQATVLEYAEKKIKESQEAGLTFCAIKSRNMTKYVARQLKKRGFKVKVIYCHYEIFYRISW